MSTSQPASVFALPNQQQTAVTQVAAAASQQKEAYRLPDATTLQNVTKFAISEDKPIMLDYWTASIEKKALIGVRENNEKLLVKSDEEYTSPIQKIFKAGNDFIIMTENSIYIVDNKIPTKRIS
jgi:hypothetical protein